MNANGREGTAEPLMHAKGRELILKREVFEVVGCALEVLNALGHGLLEKPYENALVVEFGLRGIPFKQQPRFDVRYKGVVVGEYVPDLMAYERLVVDTKVIERIGNHELGQMLNYLKITRLQVGLILNSATRRWSGSASCCRTANEREGTPILSFCSAFICVHWRF